MTTPIAVSPRGLSHDRYNGVVTRIEVLRNPDWHRGLWDEWTELFNSTPSATPFQSPAWVSAWCQTIGERKPAHVVAVRAGSDLVGLFPMVLTRTPWRALRFMGTGVSDILRPLVRPGFESAAMSAWNEHIESLNGVDLIDLQQMRHDTGAMLADPAALTQQAVCPVLELPDRFEDYVKTLSKSLRYDVSKGLRREFEWRASLSPQDAQANFEVFLDLHSQRWRKRGLPGAFGFKKIQRFHREFLRLAGPLVELETLWHEGCAIGALYVMATPTSSFFYQSGFDPQAKKLCPGTVLVAGAIRRAIESGRTHFDFLRGDEPYKLRWQPQRVVPNYRLITTIGGVRGSLGSWVNRVESALEERIRRRLEGRGLIS